MEGMGEHLQVGLLKDLRLLEIQINSYQIRTRSCLLSLLQGVDSLSNLKGLIFQFEHAISDLHIQDLSEYMQKHFETHCKPIDMLGIRCVDISLKQLQTLISNLDNHAKRGIDVVMQIPRNAYRSLNKKMKLTKKVFFRFDLIDNW